MIKTAASIYSYHYFTLTLCKYIHAHKYPDHKSALKTGIEVVSWFCQFDIDCFTYYSRRKNIVKNSYIRCIFLLMGLPHSPIVRAIKLPIRDYHLEIIINIWILRSQNHQLLTNLCPTSKCTRTRAFNKPSLIITILWLSLDHSFSQLKQTNFKWVITSSAIYRFNSISSNERSFCFNLSYTLSTNFLSSKQVTANFLFLK